MSEHPEILGAFAAPADASRYFGAKLGFETDCADVHAALESGGFALVDVRSPEAYAAGHVEGAVNLPHRWIDADRLNDIAEQGPFVVYCWGPHCNGADRAAFAVAAAGREVKIMIGGVHGWELEGYTLTAPSA